jgi:hypothetical protein
VSRKNNVNSDHYKTAGRGRPGEVAAAADTRKHSHALAPADARAGREAILPGSSAAETSAGAFGRLQRLRRRARLRGLSAKRLSERRRLLRQAGLG